MPFLAIDGTPIPASLNALDFELEVIGEETRAFSGDGHDTKRAHKARISGHTDRVPVADIGAVVTALKSQGAVTLSGDLITALVAAFGISTSFTVRMGRVQILAYQGGLRFRVPYTLREV